MESGKLGYDRAIVTFSPDGRLFQVEYAREAVKKGSLSVGVKYDEGVALVAVRYSDALCAQTNGNEKIQQIDDHIGAVSAGTIADARVLIDRARIKAQIHRITYEEPIDVPSLVKYIADYKQMHTQYAGLRPMGVSFLIAGVNDRPYLFETDPGGAMFEWKAQAIGRNTEEAREILENEYRDGMNEGEALSLALNVIKRVEKKVTKKDIEIALVDSKGFRELRGKEKDAVLKKW
ncbi:MAG: proteasome subunit alpha [Candidatus Aenigmatarchaeota archaeon]|nr:MAG: proteasome subunit alpha [Candidatus Aenigmarchaeota archaeon]